MSTPLDKILACPTLPSLPAVAMKVLELARNPRVSFAEMAKTVQADPALATKVLKTVNSSYYGLTTPCPSISRAMSLLGMDAVKSIVLGFSLVDTTKGIGTSGFDMEAYWRRAIYGAAAARVLATHGRQVDPEEAFVGSLLQDIGMLAMLSALKTEYPGVLAMADDHEKLAKAEKDALGIDHCEAGRALGERWHLPAQVLDSISMHHCPPATLPMKPTLVQTVAVANLAAAALSNTDSKSALGAYLVQAREIFKLDQAAARAILEKTDQGAKELAKQLDIKTGARVDIAALMADALEQITVAQVNLQMETLELKRSNRELERQTITDGLTGAFNRAHFDKELQAAFVRAKSNQEPLSIIFIDADKFKSVNDTHGHQAGDGVLMELSRRLREAGSKVGTVCRYGGEEFAIILPQIDSTKACKLAELLRLTICKTPFDLHAHEIDLVLPISISVGVSGIDANNMDSVKQPEQITHAADQGVYAAKKTGRNRVCFVPLGKAATNLPPDAPIAPQLAGVEADLSGTGRTVLVIEDDPLAARLVKAMFNRRKDLRPVFMGSAEEALEQLKLADSSRIHAVLSDHTLPGMSGIELAKLVRSIPTLRAIPFILMTASEDPELQGKAREAGVNSFVDKPDLFLNADRWLGHVADLITAADHRPGETFDQNGIPVRQQKNAA